MIVAVLLRLISDGIDEERVAGHAEIVDTGQTHVFKDEEEMLALLHRAKSTVQAAESAREAVDPAT